MTRLQPKLSTNLGLLYATDCFNLFPALRDESIDCVFADPPFNLGKEHDGPGPALAKQAKRSRKE